MIYLFVGILLVGAGLFSCFLGFKFPRAWLAAVGAVAGLCFGGYTGRYFVPGVGSLAIALAVAALFAVAFYLFFRAALLVGGLFVGALVGAQLLLIANAFSLWWLIFLPVAVCVALPFAMQQRSLMVLSALFGGALAGFGLIFITNFSDLNAYALSLIVVPSYAPQEQRLLLVGLVLAVLGMVAQFWLHRRAGTRGETR